MSKVIVESLVYHLSGNTDVERLQQGAPLAALKPETLYGGGAEGYIDYPALAGAGE